MQINEQNTDNKLITSQFEAFWFEPNVFYIRLYKDSTHHLEDVEQIVAFQKEQGVNQDVMRIVHAEKFASVTKRGREYLQENAPTVKAEAYIIPSLAQKILFNLYVKLRKNNNPIKGFDNLDDSLLWLKKFK